MPNQRAGNMVGFNCTLPRELADQVRELADRRLTTRSAIIRQALAEFLSREKRATGRSEH